MIAVATRNYLQAIEHLPSGATFTFHRVPEIWRCDERRMEMYHLGDAGYVKAGASRAFPFLTGKMLFQFLERSQTEGQSATLRAFRAWVKTQSPA